jgi:hypothetical protein
MRPPETAAFVFGTSNEHKRDGGYEGKSGLIAGGTDLLLGPTAAQPGGSDHSASLPELLQNLQLFSERK